MLANGQCQLGANGILGLATLDTKPDLPILGQQYQTNNNNNKHSNNSDIPLISRRTNGGKNKHSYTNYQKLNCLSVFLTIEKILSVKAKGAAGCMYAC